MTSKRTSTMPTADLPLSGVEKVYVVQNGNSRQIPAAVLFGAGGGSDSGSALTRILSGGNVEWDTAFNFRVSAATYLINGVAYQSLEQVVTLNAADAVNDRIDVIALDTNGLAIKLTGDPSPTPAAPDVDDDTQLELTFVQVPHGAVAPPSTDPGGGGGGGPVIENLYLDNAEWASAPIGAQWNLNSAIAPRTGAKCIRGTSPPRGSGFTLTRAAAIDAASYTSLRMFVFSHTARWGTGRLTLQFRNAAGTLVGRVVALQNNTFGLLTGNTAAYQQIAIPLSSFALPAGTQIKGLDAKWSGFGTVTVDIDDITLQPNVSGGGTGGGGSTTPGLDQTTADARYAQRAQNLADLTDAAAARKNLGLLRPITIQCVQTAPVANELLGVYPAIEPLILSANLANSKSAVITNPTAAYTVTIARQVNGAGGFATIGTISVSTAGVVAFATSGGTAVTIAAGDVLKFTGDSDGDTTFQGAFTLYAKVNG